MAAVLIVVIASQIASISKEATELTAVLPVYGALVVLAPAVGSLSDAMDLILRTLLFLAGIGGGVVVSLVIEAWRRRPRSPEVGGSRLRYIRSGRGPSLVLLHTRRTQLDLFEKVIPQLARDFT